MHNCFVPGFDLLYIYCSLLKYISDVHVVDLFLAFIDTYLENRKRTFTYGNTVLFCTKSYPIIRNKTVAHWAFKVNNMYFRLTCYIS